MEGPNLDPASMFFKGKSKIEIPLGTEKKKLEIENNQILKQAIYNSNPKLLKNPKKTFIITFIIELVFCVFFFLLLILIFYAVNSPLTQKSNNGETWLKEQQDAGIVILSSFVSIVGIFGISQILRFTNVL